MSDKAENMKNTFYALEKRNSMMLEQARAKGEVSPAVERFMELLKDEAFVKDFANCASAEAVKELLDRNGVDFSMEEIDSILVGIGTLVQKLEENDGELSEEELEMIAGGFSWTGFFAGIGGGILMAAACVGVAVAMGITAGAAAPVVAAGIAKVIAIGAAAGTVVGTGAGFLFD